jgi:hypothetical protein
MMTLWIDRQASVTGPGVHALVIGVSDYTYLPEDGHLPERDRETLGLTKVDIPATGAFSVAKWLRDEYWHPTNEVKSIRLLLSPSQHEINPSKPEDSALSAADRNELAAVGKAAPATTENVTQALDDWCADCRGHPGDIAALYISGHGIQWADKDDGIVLLQDFSKDGRFLNQTVSIRKVNNGMSGSDMPQTQLYFVDACSIHPDEYAKFVSDTVGTPVGLPSKFKGDDLRSAPIYFAACPQTTAKGRPNRGTYFAEAVVDCLSSAGLLGPDPNSELPIAQTYWHISITNLVERLQKLVTAIAKRDGQKQEVVAGGRLRAGVFCAAKVPPPVKITVNVDPAEAARVAHTELWQKNSKVCDGIDCQPPAVFDAVPPGIYTLRVNAAAPFSAMQNLELNAQPPSVNVPVSFS